MELIKEIKSALESHNQTKGNGRITDVELYASMWLKSLVEMSEQKNELISELADVMRDSSFIIDSRHTGMLKRIHAVLEKKLMMEVTQ